MEESAAHRKRIRRLKKMILGAIALAILIPVILCVVLAVQNHRLSLRIKLLQGSVDAETVTESENREDHTYRADTGDDSGLSYLDFLQSIAGETEAADTSDEEGIASSEDAQSQARQIYLTFDDGPSSNTNEILDILKAYDVKATFFVTGKTDEASKAAYQRIVEEGHTLGMHSYSHSYEDIYRSRSAFRKDLKKLQEYLYEVTGVWSRYYRFPGGSSNTVTQTDIQSLIAVLEDRDITYFDWNVASGDAVSGYVSSDTLVRNCLNGIAGKQVSVILMHDAADKDTTVQALSEVITQIRLQGDAEFLAISEDTPLVQHISSGSAANSE